MSVVEEIKQTADGASLLYDWLGEGGHTVSRHHAEIRAVICLDCPEHRITKWWEKMVKDPIAETIRKELAIRHQMRVDTAFDDRLFMCRACGCCLRLKVHVPASHIKQHTPPETLSKYPPNCWIPSELEAV